MTDLMTDAQPDPDRHAAFYSGVPAKRALAWIIDTILVTLIVTLVALLTALTALFILPLVWLTVGFLYRWVTISGRSATLGMRLMSIEFLDRYGQRFDAATAFLHTLGYSLSMAFVLPQVISVGLMLVSRRGQGLTDMVLGSVAINSRA
ncbi:RDD family protein [Tabrizicola sp. M-4]|uniref:RDD family protein n=1 Tax=Tabrizicola sp. M-4 TaxID=3055847 RepID=UPI003DA7A9D0